MNRSDPWASDWLKRYDNEGITGLKNRTKCGRQFRVIRRDRVQDKDHSKGKQPGLDDKAD